jgi:peptidoglycan hydrolase-like protein with peptidoglycan-binding domain
MAYTASKLIEIAEAEVGYLEKKSNSNLDSKTENAGYNNYTKYARDLKNAGYYNGNKNGYAWCDVFVDWLFYQLCDKDARKAEDMICQTGDYGAGCTYSMRYYKNAGRFYSSPKPGDQIFFGSGSNASHTGIVYKVDSSKVYTIEGNTSSASGVVANGGGVFKKSYARNYAKILGYGRPRYNEEPVTNNDTTKAEEEYNMKQFVKDVQKACGAAVDGIAGKETISKTVTLSSKKNTRHAAVKAVQKRLTALGYVEVGKIDGVAGMKFTSAVAHFQMDNGCVVDGEITAQKKTWRKLLGME